MTELEKYIKDNLESYDCEDVPAGSKERFMRKVETSRKTRRLIVNLTIPAAAAIAFLIYTSSPSVLEKELKNLARQESEVISLVNMEHPEEIDDVINTLHAITYEATPIEELLPESLSQKEKDEIIKNYYQEKSKAIEKVMEHYLTNR